MKHFKATWGEGYYKPDTAIITLKDINDKNGWDDWAIEKIEQLSIGETADCTDISGVLYVKRIAQEEA